MFILICKEGGRGERERESGAERETERERETGAERERERLRESERARASFCSMPSKCFDDRLRFLAHEWI